MNSRFLPTEYRKALNLKQSIPSKDELIALLDKPLYDGTIEFNPAFTFMRGYENRNLGLLPIPEHDTSCAPVAQNQNLGVPYILNGREYLDRKNTSNKT